MLLKKSKNLSCLTIDSYNRNIGFYDQFDIILNEEILKNSTLKKIKFLKISDMIPKNLELFSKICNDIETLIIECVNRQNHKEIFNLIEVQCNLKNLIIKNSIPSLDKSLTFHPHSFTITRIKFDNRENYYISHYSLSTILQSCTRLENLEFYRWNILEDESREELSKIHFTNLKSLKIEYSKLPFMLLNGIIEVNGYNLEELCFTYDNYSVFELELLSKTICRSCRQLSSLTLQVYYEDEARKHRDFIKCLENILQKLMYFKFRENVFQSPINIIDILNVLK
jgi:hypothetical protein